MKKVVKRLAALTLVVVLLSGFLPGSTIFADSESIPAEPAPASTEAPR